MTGKADRIPDYIGHILDAISQIESYTADLNQKSFERSRLVQDAVIRNFEIIALRNSIRMCAST